MFERFKKPPFINSSVTYKFKKLQCISHVLQNNVYFLKIFSTLNNLYITLTNNLGHIIVTNSGGFSKVSSSKRNTNYSLELLLYELKKTLIQLNIKSLILTLDILALRKKKSILKVLQKFNIRILGIQIKTAKAFNGVRPCKRRRI
jgi:small subunit ribosomal protein S11